MLTAAKLWPPMMESLRGAFRVHDRTHQSDAAAFAAAAPRIRAIAASGESKVPRELIAQLPTLEIVSVFGVGYDGVDVAAARERGIAVTHTPERPQRRGRRPGDGARPRRLAPLSSRPTATCASGAWANGPMPLARKVSGARMGIVGLGRIGMAIAKRAEAFGMSIAYTSRNARAGVALPLLRRAPRRSPREVDFLVVITPGGAGDAKAHRRQGAGGARQEGLPRQRRARLGRRRAGAGRARCATARSPAPASTCSRTSRTCRASCSRLDNVVLTPHVGSATWQTRQAMADLAFGNLEAHFAGKPLLSPVP